MAGWEVVRDLGRSSLLTDLEKREILQHKEVYFTGIDRAKVRRK